VAGRLHWVHSASTASLTWQTAHPKRGGVAMDAAGVLPAFGGVAVHDGWSPYWHYQAVHALCGAHLLRELEAIGDAPRYSATPSWRATEPALRAALGSTTVSRRMCLMKMRSCWPALSPA
jgi:Transposase IS66 family